MKRILCLWLPNWPIQRLVAAQPELRSHPVVLHAVDAYRKPRVVACSQAARRLGVRLQMPFSEAEALVERSLSSKSEDVADANGNAGAGLLTNSCLAAHEPEDDLQALRRLAVWSQRFSPCVGWDTVVAGESRTRTEADALRRSSWMQSDYLFLDVSGMGCLFGGEGLLLRKVCKAFRRRDYFVSLALASSPAAAWALARWGKFSTDAPLPRWRVWSVAEERAEIAALPVRALRIDDATLETLQTLGVQTVEQLERLPQRSLKARFGSQLLLRWRQLRGHLPEHIAPYHAPESFRSAWRFDPPTERREHVEGAVRSLIDQVCQQLQTADRGAVRLVCVLRRNAAESKSFSIELFHPSCSADHLFGLMKMRLESLRLRDAVSSVEVEVPIASRLDIPQSELFSDGRRQGRRELPRMLDRLSARLGRRQVLDVRETADPQPEAAMRLSPVAGEVKRRSGRSRKAVHPRGAGHRPLRLYSPPREIQTMAIAPNGPPIRFAMRNRPYRVVLHWGPERIETGWWRGRSVRRDYYQVETERGGRFWLFRELNGGRWFLHGEFV